MITTVSVIPDAATRLYWLRAYHRSLRHLHRASAAYAHSITCNPDLGWPEWQTWQTARRRKDYTAEQLRRVMGW